MDTQEEVTVGSGYPIENTTGGGEMPGDDTDMDEPDDGNVGVDIIDEEKLEARETTEDTNGGTNEDTVDEDKFELDRIVGGTNGKETLKADGSVAGINGKVKLEADEIGDANGKDKLEVGKQGYHW